MLVLTLTQPYPTLIAVADPYPALGKHHETRSWPPTAAIGARLAIHAGQGLGPVGGKAGLRDLCGREPFRTALRALYGDISDPVRTLLRGAIVAVATIAGVYRVTNGGWMWSERSGIILLPPSPDRDFGDYSPGRYIWRLTDIRQIAPLAWKGAQGLRRLPDDVAAEVERRAAQGRAA